MIWLHRYTRVLAASCLLLIAAGGLVTSTGSGLSVPDWPNTYGRFMFSFPLSQMVGGIFYEHGHRLIASVVGLMTIGVAVWTWRVDPRHSVRRLGWLALVAVVVQGLLGGITVLYFLPPAVSVSHAGLAQLFFALVVTLAVLTSPGWLRSYDRGRDDERAITGDTRLTTVATALPVVIYLQILVGAAMRHTGAGLAIPDFPLAFGRLLPPVWDGAIAVHFTHRVGAVLVSIVVALLVARIVAAHRGRPELMRPALLLTGLVLVQLTLGALTVLSQKHVAINTAHVVGGALLFVTSVTTALRVHRHRFATQGDRGSMRHPTLTTAVTAPDPTGAGS